MSDSVAFAEPKCDEQHASPAVGFFCLTEKLKVDLHANDLSKMFVW